MTALNPTAAISSIGLRKLRAAMIKTELESAKRMHEEQTAEKDRQERQAREQNGLGPVGTGDYVVDEGECLSSIAKSTGHHWETIWNDSANAELNAARQDPNVLFPGDRLTIPPIRKRNEPGETERRHRFVRKGEPTMFRIRLMVAGEPRAFEDFVLTIDNMEEHTGTTDASGNIAVAISATARQAVLELGDSDCRDVYQFALGQMDPSTEVTGIQKRLINLGFNCGLIDGKLGPRSKFALKKFQKAHALQATGCPDAPTQSLLKEMHGS